MSSLTVTTKNTDLTIVSDDVDVKKSSPEAIVDVSKVSLSATVTDQKPVSLREVVKKYLPRRMVAMVFPEKPSEEKFSKSFKVFKRQDFKALFSPMGITTWKVKNKGSIIRIRLEFCEDVDKKIQGLFLIICQLDFLQVYKFTNPGSDEIKSTCLQCEGNGKVHIGPFDMNQRLLSMATLLKEDLARQPHPTPKGVSFNYKMLEDKWAKFVCTEFFKYNIGVYESIKKA